MLPKNKLGIAGVIMALVFVVAAVLVVLSARDGEPAKQPKTVRINPPSSVSEPLPPVADVDLEERKKKTGKVKITQDTLDRITGGEETLVAVPLFDGEVIQVQLEERQPLGSTGMLVYGKVQGEPNSQAHFSIVKHAMVAKFTLEDGREFKIESLPQGKHEYQLIEIDTVAVLRHFNRPGVPEPVHTGILNGEKVVAEPCRFVDIPKSQMPLRKMLGAEAWDPEMKVVALKPNQDGLSNRVKLRQPYGGRINKQSSQTPQIAADTSKAVAAAAPWQGWSVTRIGQWQKKPVYAGSGGISQQGCHQGQQSMAPQQQQQQQQQQQGEEEEEEE